ncbi:efflux RND transporter permease subunit [Limnobacter parvus]|uniref:Efflux RND transporter permease subunit n=1 Tax=Limnobacter parvus TaxID=2939690 RepID=A0ABT1XJH5_9BURK|nr:efflux RND transporter permease subunit [Limnobacter parvus]MCR2747031.1 efflux RND transporter permease subunit [Limnobacter parvus]
MSRATEGLTALGLKRPVLIVVLNLLIMLAGVVSMFGMEVRELPDIDRPVVLVRAVYQGASPTTMDAEVTSKVEGAVARVSGVLRIQSSSEENNMRVRMEFSPDVDVNVAANDVREAVSRITNQLPENLDQLLVIKADDDARPVVQLAVYSNTLAMQDLAERVERDLVPAFVSVTGVADVPLNGSQPRVLRVLLDPAKLARFGMVTTDVLSSLESMNLDVPAGSYLSGKQELLVRANASTIDTEAINSILIGNGVRVRDVADVFYGPMSAESYSLLNGRAVVGMGVLRQAGGNTIAIASDVKKRMAEINAQSKDLQVIMISDDSVFIKGALQEVLTSLVFAVLVVLVVIALFLGQWRAVLIPAVTMPVALVGTLAAIWLAGFSVNMLTLLALVLATGLIVDDAIVVLENIQRRKKLGESITVASVLGTQQVFFAVIATTASLVAVFLPIAFLPGETGRLFREFGMVLSMAVIISTFVALSLCPMLAVRLLKEDPPTTGKGARFMGRMEHAGDKIANYYFRTLDSFLKHRLVSLLFFVGIAISGAFVFTLLSQELVPPEDRGRLVVDFTGPDGASLEYSGRQGQIAEKIMRPYQEQGLITDFFTIVGRYDKNRVAIQANLADWGDRDTSQQELAAKLSKELSSIPGAQVRFQNESSLNIRGGGGGLQVALLGDDYDVLANNADLLADALIKQIDAVQDVRVQYDTSQPELGFEIDREKATDLQVPVSRITQTLQILADEYQLIDLSVGDQAVPVMLGSSKGSLNSPFDLLNVYTKSDADQLVPLASMISVEERGVAAELDRHGQRRAVELNIGIPPGTDLGTAMQQIRAVAAAELPSTSTLIFLGEAATLEETSNEMFITFAVALVVVFLVLAAQFESVGSAVVVMFTVPFGLAAAVFALLLTGQSLNLFSQIGLVLLIGLMTKNAILLVEMMDQLRDEGHTVESAVREGARLRLRPIAMTVLSTVLGVLPLVLTSGPGAEAREAIAWVVLGGLGLSTVFTLYLAPMGYSFIAPYMKPRAHAAELLDKEIDEYEARVKKDEVSA